MTLLEGTIALSILSGVTYTTLQMTEEVEKKAHFYQQVQEAHLEQAIKLGYKIKPIQLDFEDE